MSDIFRPLFRSVEGICNLPVIACSEEVLIGLTDKVANRRDQLRKAQKSVHDGPFVNSGCLAGRE